MRTGASGRRRSGECVSPVIHSGMGEATVRQLRNQGAAVIDRVLGGEHVTITRDGEPVAELLPLRRRPLTCDVLLQRFRLLPSLDPALFREDIDRTIDQAL